MGTVGSDIQEQAAQVAQDADKEPLYAAKRLKHKSATGLAVGANGLTKDLEFYHMPEYYRIAVSCEGVDVILKCEQPGGDRIEKRIFAGFPEQPFTLEGSDRTLILT